MIGDANYANLWKVSRIILVLSYGQADVESGGLMLTVNYLWQI